MREGLLPAGVALPHAHVRAEGGWARGGRGFSRGAHVREAERVAPPRGGGAMELEAARRAVLAAVRGTLAADLPRLLHWMRNTRKRRAGPRPHRAPGSAHTPSAPPAGRAQGSGARAGAPPLPGTRGSQGYRRYRLRRSGRLQESVAGVGRLQSGVAVPQPARVRAGLSRPGHACPHGCAVSGPGGVAEQEGLRGDPQTPRRRRSCGATLLLPHRDGLRRWGCLVQLHTCSQQPFRDDFDELVVSNDDVVLRNIAEDLRNRLPIEAMFTSEHQAVQKIHQHPLPMIHVDAFLYDDDDVDSLCEEGKMSRSYCTECGSYKTASLEFISHSFSLMELKFLYQHVLPDLTGKVVVDVGSRLGAVLFAGYLYSSASQLYGVEMNADFCQLQEMMITKYKFIDRIKVVHADICTQPSLLQKADVVVMNNVFEYFLDRQEQARAWEFIVRNVRKGGSLLVTVPSLEESLSKLKTDVQLSQWVEEVQLNYDVCMEKDVDREALEQIHLYKIL
ncbi:uncharacterized protein LOC134045564 [Cinclus cinclus]|uniref:uncharacterized protein LOC134045564 n=1 Tax=Cinclus cinclus TaxID=127875 RepID=UPI002E107D28